MGFWIILLFQINFNKTCAITKTKTTFHSWIALRRKKAALPPAKFRPAAIGPPFGLICIIPLEVLFINRYQSALIT